MHFGESFFGQTETVNTQQQQTNVTRRGRSVGREGKWEWREESWKIKWEVVGGGGRLEKGATAGAELLLLDFRDSPRTGLQESVDLLC